MIGRRAIVVGEIRQGHLRVKASGKCQCGLLAESVAGGKHQQEVETGGPRR